MKVKTKRIVNSNKKMTRRQNFKLAKMDRKVQMGKHSGKTARAISRHQAAAVISGNLNTMNVKTDHNVNANITIDKKGSLASVDSKPQKEPSKSNTSTDILGWMN